MSRPPVPPVAANDNRVVFWRRWAIGSTGLLAASLEPGLPRILGVQAAGAAPLVLPSGIKATADPILRARSAAYAESYRRRAKEQFQGALGETSHD